MTIKYIGDKLKNASASDRQSPYHLRFETDDGFAVMMGLTRLGNEDPEVTHLWVKCSAKLLPDRRRRLQRLLANIGGYLGPYDGQPVAPPADAQSSSSVSAGQPVALPGGDENDNLTNDGDGVTDELVLLAAMAKRRHCNLQSARRKLFIARTQKLGCCEITGYEAIIRQALPVRCEGCGCVLRGTALYTAAAKEEDLPQRCPSCDMALGWDACGCCRLAWCWSRVLSWQTPAQP